MAGELHFHHWKRSTAAKDAALDLATGRLHGQVVLTLSELVSTGRPPPSQPLPFYLMGPADVTGLRPGAVTHTYPAPGAADVEVTKSPYAEFAEPDLPWRYTVDAFPAPTLGTRPWLVLVVGTTEEMWLGRGTVTFTGTVVKGDPPLDLDQSARWAHVQAHNGQEVARLLCPRKLKPKHDYLAVIVPAYKADGADSWDTQTLDEDQTVTIAAYYWWHFRTTDTTKDFRILATDILARPVAPENRIGVAPLAYYTDDTQQPAPLEVGGALTTPAPTPPVPEPVLNHLAALFANADVFADELGRPIVQMPRYGEPWLTGEQRERLAWSKALNGDPRHRGVAGLGMWAGIAWQELIVDAARRQAGELYIAAQRIRALTAGLAVSQRLWKERKPEDQYARLMMYGPSLGRMVTERGTVLKQVTGADRPLPPALFTSAARRVLRPGGARGRWTQDGALRPSQVVQAANDCEQITATPRNLGDLPHDDVFEQEFGFRFGGALTDDFPFDVEGLDDSFFELTAQDTDETRLHLGGTTLRGRMEVARAETDGMFAPLVEEDRTVLKRPERPCRRVRLKGLIRALDGAINPNTTRPLVVERVLDVIRGLDDQPLAPPELCPDFDLPGWRFLRDNDKNWLLPGVDKLEPDSLIAVQTNPAFVDAFLVGLNQQALGELRWRNVPVVAGCTPLRRFWERLNHAGDGIGHDIESVARWAGQPEETPLGAQTHQTPEAQGTDLVLVFRTELFRRYPNTLVYLAPRKDDDADWEKEPDWTKPRITPTFPGAIGSDISYFGFDVGVDTLDTHWIVVEEVPRGFTFHNYNAVGVPNPGPLPGGNFAQVTFARPVRVLFEGQWVKEQTEGNE